MKAEERLMIFNLSGSMDLLLTAQKLGANDTDDLIKSLQDYITTKIKELTEKYGEKEAHKLVKAAGEYTYGIQRKNIAKNQKFVVVGSDGMTKLVNEVVKYNCLGCDKTKTQAKNCWLRKTMEEEGYESVAQLFDSCPFGM